MAAPAQQFQLTPSSRSSLAEAAPSNPSGRSLLGTSGTPLQLRGLSVLCVIAVLAASLLAWFLTDRLVEETATTRDSTGEVLIANQSILASLAEADTAAAAVHLAGAQGDQTQRRVYELALERAGSQLEGIAASLGDHPQSHTALQRVGASLTTYSGEIEAARLASIEDLPGANERFNQAIQTVRSEITPDLQFVTTEAEQRFTSDIESSWYLLAILGFVVPIILIALAQYLLFRRFRRIVNLPLALATLVLIGLTGWMWLAWSAQQSALEEARSGAYEAIGVSAGIQTSAFAHRAEVTGAVITGDEVPSTLDTSEAGVTALIETAIQGADTEREVAAANSMAIRWGRYLDANDELVAAIAGNNIDQARAAVRGSSNAAFTGFNTSVEAALFDNRNQFEAAVDTAGAALTNLRLALFIGAALAAVLTWFGFSLRIREYR